MPHACARSLTGRGGRRPLLPSLIASGIVTGWPRRTAARGAHAPRARPDREMPYIRRIYGIYKSRGMCRNGFICYADPSPCSQSMVIHATTTPSRRRDAGFRLARVRPDGSGGRMRPDRRYISTLPKPGKRQGMAASARYSPRLCRTPRGWGQPLNFQADTACIPRIAKHALA